MELDFEVLNPDVAELVSTEIQERVQTDLKALFSGATIEKITAPEQLANVTALGQQTKAKRKEWEDERDSLVRPYNNKVGSINEYFRPVKAAFTRLIDNLEKVAGRYTYEQEKIRQEKQRIEDEKARIARLKAEDEARQKREAEEKARRDAEEKRRQAQESKDAEEKKRLNDEAASLDKKAEREAQKAESKEAVASNTVSRVITGPAIPKGVGNKFEYWPDITDANAFIFWCASNEKFHFLLINEKVLGKQIDLEKDAFKAPGIKVMKDIKGSIASIRAKKTA